MYSWYRSHARFPSTGSACPTAAGIWSAPPRTPFLHSTILHDIKPDTKHQFFLMREVEESLNILSFFLLLLRSSSFATFPVLLSIKLLSHSSYHNTFNIPFTLLLLKCHLIKRNKKGNSNRYLKFLVNCTTQFLQQIN